MKVRLHIAVHQEEKGKTNDQWSMLISKVFEVPEGICFVPGINFGILPPVARMNYVTFAKVELF